MSESSVARVELPELGKIAGGSAGLPAREDGYGEARVIEFGWARQLEKAREREDHWTEVDLVLEMWDRVARSWNNDTLVRLARYARLEVETERELERKSR